MDKPDGYSVSTVARLAGITVRTLHHYDEVGLFRPERRSAAGYRRYSDRDLARLREILFYRELGLSIAAISEIIDAPDHRHDESLRTQRNLLVTERARIDALIGAVDAAIAADRNGVKMTAEDMFEVFGGFDPGDYADEVEKRWGGPAVDESRRRTEAYRKADWQAIKTEADEILAAFAAAKRAGESPTATAATNVAERHRRHIDHWFYPCSIAMHANLGAMYVSDPRFTEYWDTAEPGLAQYVQEAIRANGARS
jgi:DNA-binding transcriptional MerR regulator